MGNILTIIKNIILHVLYWGLPPPIKLEKSLNNLKCVENEFKFIKKINLNNTIQLFISIMKKPSIRRLSVACGDTQLVSRSREKKENCDPNS